MNAFIAISAVVFSILGVSSATELALGDVHSCVLWSDNKVQCWGYNNLQQLGIAGTSYSTETILNTNLRELDFASGFTPEKLVAYGDVTCAVSTGKDLVCWGSNDFGEAGRALSQTSVPSDSSALDFGASFDVKQVAPGEDHTCVLSEANKVVCFGDNEFGQLGNGDTMNRNADTPGLDQLPEVLLGSGLTVSSLYASDQWNCALFSNNKFKCWGNADGTKAVLGYGNDINYGSAGNQMGDDLPFVNLGTGFDVQQLALGDRHGCALSTNNEIKCWGDNIAGQVGNDIYGGVVTTMGNDLPKVEVGFTPVAIKAGKSHTCALSDTDAIKCWGRHRDGETGLEDFDTYYVGDGVRMFPFVGEPERARAEMGNALPLVQLGSFTPSGYAVGQSHNCVVNSADQIKCWGKNLRNQLGIKGVVTSGNSGSTKIGDESGEMGADLPIAFSRTPVASPTAPPSTPSPTILQTTGTTTAQPTPKPTTPAPTILQTTGTTTAQPTPKPTTPAPTILQTTGTTTAQPTMPVTPAPVTPAPVTPAPVTPAPVDSGDDDDDDDDSSSSSSHSSSSSSHSSSSSSSSSGSS